MTPLDARHRTSYMPHAMRLLLLLSALLTAMTGAMVSTAAVAQPVERSASVSAQDQRSATAEIVAPRARTWRLAAATLPHIAISPARAAQHPRYGDRLRE